MVYPRAKEGSHSIERLFRMPRHLRAAIAVSVVDRSFARALPASGSAKQSLLPQSMAQRSAKCVASLVQVLINLDEIQAFPVLQNIHLLLEQTEKSEMLFSLLFCSPVLLEL